MVAMKATTPLATNAPMMSASRHSRLGSGVTGTGVTGTGLPGTGLNWRGSTRGGLTGGSCPAVGTELATEKTITRRTRTARQPGFASQGGLRPIDAFTLNQECYSSGEFSGKNILDRSGGSNLRCWVAPACYAALLAKKDISTTSVASTFGRPPPPTPRFTPFPRPTRH